MSSADALDTLRLEFPEKRGAAPQISDFTWRILSLLNVFRLALGCVLLAAFALVTEPRIIGELDPNLAMTALVAMIGMACLELLLLARRTLSATSHTYLQFGVDLSIISALLHASGGISSGFGGLLVVTVGTLALLVPTERAFLFAALTTLMLLLEQTLAQLQGVTTSAQFVPAGILGAVVFIITAVVQLLRRRIVETEALAEQRGVDLQNLVELNEYIIQHLRESIVVVDGQNDIRLINESAGTHLGSDSSTAENIGDVSQELAERLAAWRMTGVESEGPMTGFGPADGSATIQPHFAPLGSSRSEGVVVFLEDTSLITERVQQTKLAALGRLSASIAHEIRNPLGAMSHAGQLLAESESIGDDDQRLTDIIRVNSKRVNRIVNSVLALSTPGAPRPERLQLRAWAEDFANEFVQTQELYEGTVAVSNDAKEFEVDIDPMHLHQILWNLCDNAVKYASETAGAISVELQCGYSDNSGSPYLEIADQGPGIDPEQMEQVFEPFYTGQPGGTGLGLYISRELCERNRVTLRYHPRVGGGSLFRIVFADPSRWRLTDEVQ